MKKNLLFYGLLLFVFSTNFAAADVYEELAKATGGKVNRMTKEEFLNQTNDGKHRYSFLQNAVPIVMQSIHITSNEKVKLAFPIDSFTFGSLVVELTGENVNTATAMTLINPSGTAIQPLQESGDPKIPVLVNLSASHTALIVPNPKEGNWNLQISLQTNSKIDGELIIRIQSSVSIQKARFLHFGGRPGHQVYFPFTGVLKTGLKQFFELSINEAEAKSLELYLVDKKGKELKKIKTSSSSDDKETITADIEIPEVPFRIRLNGTDKKGKDFQRFVDKVFTSEVSK